MLITSYCLKEAGKQNYCEQKMANSVQTTNKNNKQKKAVVSLHSENGFLWIAALEYLLHPFTDEIFQVFILHFRLCSESQASQMYVTPYITSCLRSSLILALPPLWFSDKDFLNNPRMYTKLASYVFFFFSSLSCYFGTLHVSRIPIWKILKTFYMGKEK